MALSKTSNNIYLLISLSLFIVFISYEFTSIKANAIPVLEQNPLANNNSSEQQTNNDNGNSTLNINDDGNGGTNNTSINGSNTFMISSESHQQNDDNGNGTMFSSNGTSVQIFNGPNCLYINGQIVEHGVNRNATDEERQLTADYIGSFGQYSAEIQSEVERHLAQVFSNIRFGEGFPFSSSIFLNPQQQQPPIGPLLPRPPPVPCFCESCRQQQSTFGSTTASDEQNGELSSTTTTSESNSSSTTSAPSVVGDATTEEGTTTVPESTTTVVPLSTSDMTTAAITTESPPMSTSDSSSSSSSPSSDSPSTSTTLGPKDR